MSQQLSPDGRFSWDGTQWVPVAAAPPPPPPPPAAYAPPAPPAYVAPVPPAAPAYAPPPGYPSAPPGVPTGAYGAQAPAYAPPAAPGYGAASSDVSFGEVAWNSGIPLGTGYIIRIDDIEAGKSQAANDKLVFTGQTLQPNGHIAAAFKAVWSYTLTEKAIGKLGRDMVALGLGAKRYPRDVNALAQALLADLRGMVVIVDSVESKSGDLPNTNVVGKYTGSPSPAPAAAPSPFPPQAPAPVASAAPAYAAQPMPPVSFPPAPPPGAPGAPSGLLPPPPAPSV